MSDNAHGWKVPSAGFVWVRAELVSRRGRPREADAVLAEFVAFGPGWFLVEKEDDGGERRYNLSMEQPALYRVFADLEPDRDHILQFANQYGCLGRPSPIRVLKEANKGRQLGEAFEAWHAHIATMRDMVHLWKLCERSDLEGLSGHIKWNDRGDSVTYVSRVEGATDWQSRRDRRANAIQRGAIVSGDPSVVGEGWLRRFTKGDVLLPALVYLQAEVNS
jgi:hypothetical protein